MQRIKPVPFGQSILNLECQPLKKEHKFDQKTKIIWKKKILEKKLTQVIVPTIFHCCPINNIYFI